MPVTLGAKPQHGFDEPIGLLGDCHRRIERFLDTILAVLQRSDGAGLSEQEREALDVSVRYFDVAAPRHTSDEEESLFPRMRQSMAPRVQQAMARIDALEAEHRSAELAHAEVARWCHRWLDVGSLAPPQVRRLRQVLQQLREMYARHIAVEDAEIFPLARQALTGSQLKEIGLEMAERRNLRPAEV